MYSIISDLLVHQTDGVPEGFDVVVVSNNVIHAMKK